MENILTSDYIIMNEHITNYHSYNNNSIKVSFKPGIINKEYFSFGIHIVPNILFKMYDTLNCFSFTLKFDFKLKKPENFNIYNGIEWISVKNNLDTGTIIKTLNFNFKKYWRIRTSTSVDFEISNINIYFDNNCEKFKEFQKKRKLLLIGGQDALTHDSIDIDKNPITCFGDNWIYNYKKYFTNDNNVVYNINCSREESNLKFLEGLFIFDNCIDISQRGLFCKSKEFYKILRTKVKNKICCWCDDNFGDIESYGPQDYLLYAIPRPSNEKSYYVGVGIDDSLFFPEKNDKFTILIDDSFWGEFNPYTTSILNKCIDFLKKNPNIQIIRLGYRDKRCEFIDPYKNKVPGYEVIEEKIPQKDKAKYHNNAHIWWGTHSETLGLEYFESALAGCFLVYPKGFIQDGLLDDFYKIEYDNIDDITLENLIDMYKKYSDLQREKALKYTWNNVCSRINDLLLT